MFVIKRREFMTLLGGGLPCGRPVRAQQRERMPRVGLLMPFAEHDQDAQLRVTAFREALAKLGWIEGQNIQFEYRWAADDPSRMRVYAGDLIRLFGAFDGPLFS